MKRQPSMEIIRGLLFTYDIENTDNLEREKLISSKDPNNEKELIEIFDALTKPEFLAYTALEQKWFISSIKHYLSKNDNFDAIFKTMATYFSSPITHQQSFMQTLLSRLKKYNKQKNKTQLTI
ncbi:hypothetical protein K0P33_12270 [Pseudomonas sp. ArH3a]|nr:hypothetical protein K0P33_12270 [Pseudomonas sp. ArH3a]UXZ24814.1 hypothetical protein KZH41_11630 [Pseudomonas sp. YeP6b]